MLHITNGSSAGSLIAAAGIGGKVISWDDVLHEGPVPVSGLDELRPIRARFVADVGWESYDAAVARFVRRDDVLHTSPEHDEVVLWFEHDLYDQLQLVQVLDFFAASVSGRHSNARLSLICEDRYLGRMDPDRIRDLFKDRRDVRRTELDAAREAWLAFTAENPEAVARIAASRTSPLPFLAGALLRLLEEYPSTENGLGRIERQTLRLVADGVPTLKEVFVRMQALEERIFLGDSVFVWHVERLGGGTRPLLRWNGAPLWNCAPALTETGEAVMRGDLDYADVNGIDRWLGGVHLHGRAPAWRWNAGEGRLEFRGSRA